MENVLKSAGFLENDVPLILEVINGYGLLNNPEFLLEFINTLKISKDIKGVISKFRENIGLFQSQKITYQDLLFSLSQFDDVRDINRILDAFKQNKDILQEAEKCKSCGKSMAVREFVQTRSADEAMDVFVKCLSCGFRSRPRNNL